MKHPDSEETGDNNVAGANADNLEAAAARRPSAIERQLAAAAREYGYQTHQEAADREIGRRYYYAKHRRRRRVGLVSVIALVLVVALGAAFVFTQFGGLSRNEMGGFQLGRQTQLGGNTQLGNSQLGRRPTEIPNAPPATTPPPAAPKQAGNMATTDAIPVPVTDITLWERPELLVQLVQVYRSQLAANPSDSAALAALNRLREQSLSQLETIMLGKADGTSFKSLQLVSRLFPELIDNPRFTALIARGGQIQREAPQDATALAPTEPQASTSTAIPPAPAVAENTAAPVKNVSSPPATAAEVAKKPVATVASSKPQIRVLSVTPGTMIEQRFVPSDEGTAFMVEISYRNFKNADDQSEVALVALLGTPGDAEALAEVPVDIAGDRGTKSFLMEALIPGNTGERYRLNFMLNGEFLTSSTVRLSVPRD